MTYTKNLLSSGFLVLTIAAVSLFATDILNPVSVKHEWRVNDLLLRPFPITNPPLLRVVKDYPPDRYKQYDFAELRGGWVLVTIAPLGHSSQHQNIGKFSSDITHYVSTVKRHFERAKLKPVHMSFLRLDDMHDYEYYDTIRMYREKFGSDRVDSVGITSPYFNGHGNTYSALFMQWIQRTDEMAQKGRDKFQVYNRLGHMAETYPVVMLIDPQGYVQAYWRNLGPGSYSMYQTIRSIQKEQDEARRMQAVYDGSEKRIQKGGLAHE